MYKAEYLEAYIMKKLSKFVVCLLLISSLFISNTAGAATVKTVDDFVELLYSTLVNRKADVEILYTGSNARDVEYNFDQYLLEALMMDKKNTTSDADYLVGLYHGYSMRYNEQSKFLSGKLVTNATFHIDFEYHETKKQTEKVEAKVASALRSLNINKLTDYGKVKAIHDYIVNLISYDDTYRYYSAYSGIVNKSTVCNGYALLFYKMVKEAGVPCRYVTGTAVTNGEISNHAWNIVKLDKKWYNVDITWDDPIGGTRVYYDYFLRGSKTFDKDHTPYDELGTQKFMNSYPISKTDYKVTSSDIKMATKITIEKNDSKMLILPVPQDSKVTWSSSKPSVATVSKSGKVKTVKAGKTTVTAKIVLPNKQTKKLTCKVTVTK